MTPLERQQLAPADGAARAPYSRSQAFMRCARPARNRSKVARKRFTSNCSLRPSIPPAACQALLSSPITLDAPPTPLRIRESQAPRSMLVTWLSLLTPSCCHSLSFTKSASQSVLVPFDHFRTPALRGSHRRSCLLQTRELVQLLDLSVDPSFRLPNTRSESDSGCAKEVAHLLPGLQLLHGDGLLCRHLS